MNSTKRKFKYHFRVHNEQELEAVSKMIKRRRFAARNIDSSWVEFNDHDAFLEWTKNFRFCDYMIRVYFSADHKMYQFHKEIKGILPFWLCGNDNCSKEDCEYYIYGEKHKEVAGVEYLWRCILADENYQHDDWDE